ncbi:MAG: hypothetical protein OXG74_14435 [Acidobacteria bacterium]|nr:hypothetical protein [Acidobacteriota bacterium]
MTIHAGCAGLLASATGCAGLLASATGCAGLLAGIPATKRREATE